MASTGKIRIGISGWTYPPWRKQFYPEGLAQRLELTYASTQFASIEINGTFYGLQKPDSFARWRDETPDGFVFSVKASRYITHTRRLREIETPLANFLASGLLRLGPKLGPILWQFPPSLAFDAELFETFMALLPHDTDEAVALARRHDSRMDGRAWLDPDGSRPVRHAIEIRHESFRDPAFIELLRRYKVALVCADTVKWPRLMDVTADFVYCRLHGSKELYISGYDEEALDRWATRIRAWAEGAEPGDAERVKPAATPRKSGRDVFIYFDNDVKVRAPENAARLAEKLELEWDHPAP
ncbi:MAG: DUF72 domain-containing protein [Alphaproteobacteria bacterium]|nr:DUF72 domain-containing protein [Alphaproteobacteria bacterium]MBU0795746.1 DUF72 domain-containing protein [Alphaproteobacteria bacterium]MBU0887369.1 DUF72 domain-containing protein [Alphaproteobacteria bacterium]MBU1811750.1 DUF72 domain-containing protein [Alphaproteobacteria bacterium]MBU2089077.1 DUF72 domain-containing protein [Alphaproteobacteria bacterium]